MDFDSLTSKAKELASVAMKKTSEAVDASKDKIKEMKLTADMKEQFEKLGEVFYNNVKDDPTIVIPDAMALIVEEIDRIKSDIKALGDEPDKSAQNNEKRFCGACGAPNNIDSAFCSKCGAKLD